MPNIVAQKAMQIVKEYEEKQGRNPNDVSKTRCGYDIQSDDRCIEVKGQKTKRGSWIWISNTIVRNLGKNLANYYIYIVYDINEKPKLKILEPDVIFKHLQIDTLFLLKTAIINKYGKDVDL